MKNPNEYKANISKLLTSASEDNKRRGKEWYLAARAECFKIAQESGIPIMNVCGVMAALSPRNKWERNVKDCRTLCMLRDSYKSGKYGTFTPNVEKAWMILFARDKASVLSVLKGPKVSAFFENIYDPSSHRVTVDVHMQLAAIGRYLPEDERPALTDKMYREIEAAVIDVAKANGFAPYELQAIAWLTWKEQLK